MSMNNKILLGVMILLFNTLSVPVDAQLEVQTSGDVVISKRTTIICALLVPICLGNNDSRHTHVYQ